jgi:hypothetical protein
MDHISDHDPRRYHLGMVKPAELASIESIFVVYSQCIDAAEEASVRGYHPGGNHRRKLRFGMPYNSGV